MMHAAYKVLLFGPIALPGQPAKGGYESANRRTSDGLRKLGVHVQEMPQPARIRIGGPVVAYAAGFVGLLREILKKRHAGECLIVHVTSLYKRFLYFELLFCVLCRYAGARFVYDIRAGSALKYYKQRTNIYRRAFDALINKADLVLVEGKEYLDFVRAVSDKEGLYFPNYVELNNMKTIVREEPRTQINLCYSGRVNREKGLIQAIEITALLAGAGVKCELHIIGTGTSDFLKELKDLACSLNVDKLVTFHGLVTPDRVAEILRQMHFFLFITKHSGEGHSNSLTEAMAAGVVPVCSANGFNRSVVMDGGIVLPLQTTAEDYANEILGIYHNGSWSQLSDACSSRVKQEFSADIVLPRLASWYSDLAEGRIVRS